MFTNKALMLAGWMAASMFFPALAGFTPVAKKVIDRIPEKPVVQPCKPCNSIKCDVSTAQRFDDGRVYRSSFVATVRPAPRRAAYWHRGPARRFISAPFRWLFRRRC